MSYTTHIDREQGVVELVYQGDVDLNETIESRADVVRIANENSLTRALIDLKSCQFRLSASDLYHFGNSFDKVGFPGNITISGVVNAGDEKSRFLENVAKNRFMNIKFFDNREDATKWLGLA